MNYIPQSLNGVPVTIAEPINCEIQIKRTWKERLFTWPFKPFTKTKVGYQLKDILEDGQIIKMDTGLYMTIKTYNDCEKAMFEKNTGKKFSTIRM